MELEAVFLDQALNVNYCDKSLPNNSKFKFLFLRNVDAGYSLLFLFLKEIYAKASKLMCELILRVLLWEGSWFLVARMHQSLG